nr:N-6 DNA methylase [Iodidimonas nitroreducens]
MMFEQAFKNIDDALRKEAGCTTELDYTEQSSWVLFLKYLDDLEAERATRAELEGKPYSYIIDQAHRWSKWAAPKNAKGELDRDHALIGDDLITYVNDELFPYLRGFKQRTSNPQTIEYKIGQIFSEIKPKFNSGYNLRDVLEFTDELEFGSLDAKHEMSDLYEVKIKRMGNAGRNGGEYYTPRPLIRAMIKVVAPQLGETIYDGAVGSAGFLCEAFEYMRPNAKSTKDLETLQKRTFSGVEKKSLAYVIGIMNMILHGIEAPDIVHDNSLGRSLTDIQPRDQKDVILANPPFGGSERREIQQNFPIRTGETAYLFLQHFIKMLKPGGRAAVVIKNTFLSNGDASALRKELLTTCNLHTVLDCPQGTFQGAGVKTVVLFFEKGAPTRDIWYYQLDPGRSLGKTTALTDADFDEFVRLAAKRTESPQSWSIKAADLDQTSLDMSVKNPNKNEEVVYRAPESIIDEMIALDAEGADILQSIRGML